MRDLLQKLKPSPPHAKRAVLLPDHAFFVRVLPLAAAATPAEVATQVELALDGLSPFPVAQLCHGHFHPPGADRVLVYAAYRRRFTVEDAADWAEADAVLPAFVTQLDPGRTERRALLLEGTDFLTALGWDGRDAVPAVLATRQLAPDASPEDRAAARTGLAAELKGFPSPVDATIPAGTVSSLGEEGLAFRAGDRTVRFNEAQLDALDVRHKDELAGRRKLRARDQLAWRVFAGGAAALVFAAALELAFAGVRFWQQSRVAIVAAQAPVALEIETKQKLADRIEELSTRRLRPIRMMEIVNEKRSKPSPIIFTRVVARDLYTLVIDGRTNATPEVANYESAVRAMPEIESMEPRGGNLQSRGGTATFSYTIKFKPEALRAPAPSS